MVNKEEIARRLEIICKEYDLSATAFAEKIDVGRATISHILSGRNKPSLDFIIKVNSVFKEVDLYWLLYGRGSFPSTAEQKNDRSVTSQAKDEAKNPKAPSASISPSADPIPKLAEIPNTPVSEIQRVILLFKDGRFENYEY